MTLHQYDYLFAIGTIFAFLDAWNIGANDVANSWANSVAARSLTYLQAMFLASIMEFSGSLGVGARVADTIRTKVVDTEAFADTPELLMLGMVCAVIASSTFLTMATKLGFPVSTTHSILGGVLGMGVAAVGANNVKWVGNPADGPTAVITGGVVQVFLAWIIAPVLSGIFAAAIFLITKYAVLLRKDPVRKGLFAVPVYFAVAAGLLAMLLIWKGGNYKVNLTDAQIPGVIVGVGVGFGLLVAATLVPWLYRTIVCADWELRWYHIFMGPLLLRRGEVPPPPADYTGPVRNFYAGRLTREELTAQRAGGNPQPGDLEAAAGVVDAQGSSKEVSKGSDGEEVPGSVSPVEAESQPEHKSLVGPKPDGPWHSGKVLFWYVKWALLRGVDRDVVGSQSEKSVLAGDVEEMHARAQRFDNRAEYMYTFLQIMTAATASFTHGANDVANAIGPYATIYEIWSSGVLPPAGKASVPTWILLFGGAAIVIGLWTYGYNIMKNLGNRLTLQSPSRGFSMEMGSVIAVVMATRLKLPVSTTQCITGATVGVGFCNGDWRSINWRMVAWIYLGWFVTLPATGIISGCLMGFIINAPRWPATN
ncbi:probable Phosphate-repressible phosphate permease [Cephalotrichum gorgonifer]|uniref:Phosphate transporter n=1 Tax=Cephalotrichum gorgonifer TaxID=2041049 RepID=A0AAE8MZ76_9PEZI|nr:probable Phosphate-repressible phosphate permease [Cephalotrichum gorgonifer]